MKKIMLIIMILFLISPIYAEAKPINPLDENITYSLRAGGGSSGGGSSGGGGRTSSRNGSTSSSQSNPISKLISYFFITITILGSCIVFYFKVLKSAINSKRYLRILGKKEISWKYKSIERQAIETYYSVQESWTKMDMTDSKKYMSEDLYDSFIVKLNFMEMNNKRNVLKKIKLRDIKPVSIYDDENDDKDYVWFYIKGSMIDYIINTETNEVLEGKTYPTSFIEFWKFTRKGKDKWILTKIKQQEEANTIEFQ